MREQLSFDVFLQHYDNDAGINVLRRESKGRTRPLSLAVATNFVFRYNVQSGPEITVTLLL